MNGEEAARLTRRATALRAKAVYVSDTGERVPPAEKQALERKAKELEDRVSREYTPWREAPRTPNEWLDSMGYKPPPRQPRPPAHDTADVGDMIRDWHKAREYYANQYFNSTADEEDIVEEGYRYNDEDGDW